MSKASRPPSPFNSLGAAFEQVAPQPTTVATATTRVEAPAHRVPLILIVGLDFGTAFTKCMVRVRNSQRVRPVPFPGADGAGFLLPSELGWQGGRLTHPCDPSYTQDAGPSLAYLKMALAAAVREERSDWLDAVARSLGITDPREQREAVRALVVFYLVGVLRAVSTFIQRQWPDFGRSDDQIYYNMAVPVAHARDDVVCAAFEGCLCTAVQLLRGNVELPAALPALRDTYCRHRQSQMGECHLLPEVTANVQSYVRSRGGRHGLYLFADVGAGTVDFSVFIFFADREGDRALSYLHAAVETLGSSQIELRAVRNAQVSMARQLRLIKEDARVDSTWTLNLASNLSRARDEIHAEVKNAAGRTLGFTRRKLLPRQFQTAEILYGGGGCCFHPYENSIEAAFDPRFGLTPRSQPLPRPPDVDWPAGQDQDALFRRLSVAYGLSFLPIDTQIQRFPDEIGELDAAPEPRTIPVYYAPSKDEV